MAGRGHRPGSFTRALRVAVAEAGGGPARRGDLVDATPASDEHPVHARTRAATVVEELVLGAPEVVLAY